MPRSGSRKDSAKPKGKMSAYTYFLQKCREDFRAKFPNQTIKLTEFSRECGEKWKNLPDDEREPYNQKAALDKERYHSEMQDYNPSSQEKRREKKRKDPNAPKRNLTAFFWFSHDERAKVQELHPDAGLGGIAKHLGRMWSEADPDVKNRYELMAVKDKARYDREMDLYRESGGGME